MTTVENEAVRKVTFVKDILDAGVNGGQITDIFVVDSVASKLRKNKKPYWTINVHDSSGSITCKLWDLIDGDVIPENGAYVKLRGTVSEFNGALELNIQRIRTLRSNELVELSDFVLVGPRDRHKQIAELEDLVHKFVTHPGLRAMCLCVFSDPKLCAAFRDAPAAKGMHHPYIGGLLDHSLSMARLSKMLVALYDADGRWPSGQAELSTSLLITAAIWHDIGKTRELSYSPSIGNTIEGNLIGHVASGFMLLQEKRTHYWCGIPEEDSAQYDNNNRVWLHLLHMVGSHHGKLEWGASRVPATREAVLFHLVDMIDSRMGGLDGLEQHESVDSDGFGTWSKLLDGLYWRANEKIEKHGEKST